VSEQFTFEITPADGKLNIYGTLISFFTKNSATSFRTGLLSSGGPGSNIELFAGTPTGPHAPLANSQSELIFNAGSSTVTGTTLNFTLPPGPYFLQATATAPGPGGSPFLTTGGADFTIGLFAAPVPEPGTWLLAILGVAMIGWAARRRSDMQAVAI
jgi:hypothetical protein